MKKIIGLGDLTDKEIDMALQDGARFVVYQYCISIVILTFKRTSDVYFVRPKGNAALLGLGFSILSFFLGWWGIPWGPIYTIEALWVNFRGGRDVTEAITSKNQS